MTTITNELFVTTEEGSFSVACGLIRTILYQLNLVFWATNYNVNLTLVISYWLATSIKLGD